MKVIIQNVTEAKTWNSIQISGKCYAEAFIYIFIYLFTEALLELKLLKKTQIYYDATHEYTNT